SLCPGLRRASTFLRLGIHNPQQFPEVVDEEIGSSFFQGVACQPISDAAGCNLSVGPCRDVDSRIPHYQGAFPKCARILQDLEYTDGVWLFLFKAIATIDRHELLLYAQALKDGVAWVHRFVGQDRQAERS